MFARLVARPAGIFYAFLAVSPCMTCAECYEISSVKVSDQCATKSHRVAERRQFAGRWMA
jgi:hypothetical protein